MKSGTHRGFVLVQNLVVFRHRNTENNRSHVLEAMYPFFTFTPLTTDIKQSAQKIVCLIKLVFNEFICRIFQFECFKY